jgi:hypothetical protein
MMRISRNQVVSRLFTIAFVEAVVVSAAVAEGLARG